MNKLAYVILVAFQLTGIYSNAQRFLDWGTTYGGQTWDVVNDIVSDNQQNIYACGNFWLKSDFDPSLDTAILSTTGFGTDAFIQKLDSKGKLIWAKSVGGLYHDEATAISSSPTGCVYIAGTYTDTADFDPSNKIEQRIASIGNDAYLLKLSPHGAFSWVNAFGGLGTEQILFMKMDPANNLYAVGHFTDTLDLHSNGSKNIAQSKGLYDGFVQKLDSNGANIWSFAFGGKGFDRATAITIDQNNDLLISGLFSDTATILGNQLISKGKEDVFLLKTDSAGSLIWIKQFGGIGNDEATRIISDKQGNLYLGGTFENAMYLHPDSSKNLATSNGVKDVFLLSLNSNGDFRWGKSWGGSSSEKLSGLVIDSSQVLIATGEFFGQVNFNQTGPSYTMASNSGTDGFISYLLLNGNFITAQQYGGSANIKVQQSTLNNQSRLITCGMFNASLDIDPTHHLNSKTSVGSDDIFIQQLKTSCTPTVDTINANNCYSYPAPSGKTTWFTSGRYFDTLYSTLHCDSLLIIDLIIDNGVNTDTSDVSACDTYTPKGSSKVYSQSGIYKDTVTSFSGCDSVITFELDVKKSTSYSYNASSCGSFSLPSGKIANASGIYQDTILNQVGCDSVLTVNVNLHPKHSQSINVTTCKSYKSPSGKYRWNSNGNYSDTLVSVHGCDSIVDINLKINRPDKTILTRGDTLIAFQKVLNYQWLACDDEFAKIIGATKKRFIPKNAGNYAVVLSSDNCSDTTECKYFVPVSVSELQLNKEDFQIAPNPLFGILITIKSNNYETIKLKIYNTQGQLIQEKKTVKTNEAVKIDVVPGVYFLTIINPENERQTTVYKLIKQ